MPVARADLEGIMSVSHAQIRPHGFPFDNTYARLPERLFARLDPTPVDSPRLVQLKPGAGGQPRPRRRRLG